MKAEQSQSSPPARGSRFRGEKKGRAMRQMRPSQGKEDEKPGPGRPGESPIRTISSETKGGGHLNQGVEEGGENPMAEEKKFS